MTARRHAAAAGNLVLTDGVVVLDRLRADDMEAHLAGEDEEQARRFGWWPKRSGPEQFATMLAEDERAWRTSGPRRRFAARVGDAIVGGCEARLVGDGVAHVSYWTFPQFRRRGYASRATRLVAEWALAALAIDRVELHVEADNVASLRVARNAGFGETGRSTADGLLVYERRQA